MKTSERKAAIEAYKSRRVQHGIVAVRCMRADAVWVGPTTRPGTNRNRLWFALRNGQGPNPKMQAAWNAHGEASFTYELVETFDEDLSRAELEVAVKTRLPHWRTVLNADPLLP